MTYPVHRLCATVPSLSNENYEALKADIKANGQLDDIIVSNGEVIDGRHRQRICDELGIEPRYQHRDDFDDVDIANYIFARLNQWRVMSKSQLAAWYVLNYPVQHGGDRGNQYTKVASSQNGNLADSEKVASSQNGNLADSEKVASSQNGNFIGAQKTSQNGNFIGKNDRAAATWLKENHPDLLAQVLTGEIKKPLRALRKELTEPSPKKEEATTPKKNRYSMELFMQKDLYESFRFLAEAFDFSSESIIGEFDSEDEAIQYLSCRFRELGMMAMDLLKKDRRESKPEPTVEVEQIVRPEPVSESDSVPGYKLAPKHKPVEYRPLIPGTTRNGYRATGLQRSFDGEPGALTKQMVKDGFFGADFSQWDLTHLEYTDWDYGNFPAFIMTDDPSAAHSYDRLTASLDADVAAVYLDAVSVHKDRIARARPNWPDNETSVERHVPLFGLNLYQFNKIKATMTQAGAMEIDPKIRQQMLTWLLGRFSNWRNDLFDFKEDNHG